METDFFVGDAQGSVRELADQNAAITLAQSYDPYGSVAARAGNGSTIFGYTGQVQDTSTELLDLRARWYNPYLNQFIQPDSIVPNPYQPADWNRYLYARDNPINFTDPSGLCPSCYIFYFPGVGNAGDPTGQGNSFAYLAEGEKQLINDLKVRTNSNVEEIYPYGSGGADWLAKYYPALVATDLGQNVAKVSNLASILLQAPSFPKAVRDAINCGSQSSNIKISFIGYSGGAQVAYNTAQQLSGTLFIDNFVAFGPIYKAYNQLNNISRIWELVGENDQYVHGVVGDLLYDYNSGLRTVNYGRHSVTQYHPDLDIYRNGATRCTLFGTDSSPYVHAGTGSYVDTKTYDNGMDCGSRRFSTSSGYYGRETRVDAIIDFLIYVVRVGDN